MNNPFDITAALEHTEKVMHMPQLTAEQLEILDHTAHRTANGQYCGDSQDMRDLIRLGLMVEVGRTSFCPDLYFAMTKAGRTAMEFYQAKPVCETCGGSGFITGMGEGFESVTIPCPACKEASE